MSEYNPFAAPATYGDIAGENRPTREYGGIRRLPYFGYGFLANLVIQGVQAIAANMQSPELVLATIPVAWIVMIALGFQRCKNLGANGWWALGLLVPILNLVVGLKCIACPEGYQDHKTLDTAGKIIIGLFIGAIVLALVALFFVLALGR